ncbi:MAG TPA: hypothetical protein PLJ60_01995 [Chryseolinea sp.]|nr:hypothetical protein [Chryseolinea sp.]HPM29081.1 hypothetical protein [Chryseolinea sp.]
MKKIISFSWAHALVGVALTGLLFSFSSSTGSGAHSVQIYLDSKLVIEQYISSKANTPKLILNPSEKHNELIVKYNECGRTVSGRKITLKDDHDKVLKDWSFEGESTGYKESMSCLVKDIIALKPKGSNTLKLYYSSTDFPDGSQIASIVIGDKSSTASNQSR